MKHEMRLHPEPFNLIKKGTKTIEMRLYDEKRKQIKEGDIITFTNRETGEKIDTKVLKLHIYPSFEELYNYCTSIILTSTSLYLSKEVSSLFIISTK